MTAFNYLIIASACLTVFYLSYLLAFRQSTQFKQMRYFLIFSMMIACVLPFNRFQVGTDYLAKVETAKFTESITTPDFAQNIEVQQVENKLQPANPSQLTTIQPYTSNEDSSIHWGALLVYLYFTVAILFLIRIIAQIIIATKLYATSAKVKVGNYKIIELQKQNTHFTLFRWIFINKEICTTDAYNQVLKHEKIHAQQYHSFDVLLIELLSAVMWFNPFVWMLRKSLKLVHEFLADEGVLSTGVNKFQYQQLLINQVAESSLVGFSSSFNSSTIKKRMKIMNVTQKKSRYSIWLLLPTIAILFVSTSVINAINASTDTIPSSTKPFVVVVDAGHGGNEDPGLTTNGIVEKDINLAISKLIASQQNANIKIILTRNGDKKVNFEDRRNIAKNANADLFVSLHVFLDKKGTNKRITNERRCLIGPKDPDEGLIFDKKLREIDQRKEIGLMLTPNFYLIKNATCPTVFINLGCVTFNHDLSYLKSAEGQQLISQKLFEGIVEISKLQKSSAVVTDSTLNDNTNIDIVLLCKYKNKKTGKTENVSISPQNGCTFEEGMKRALSNKAYEYIAIYTDVKSDNQIVMNSPDYIPANADSEQLTKLLNSKFKTATGLASDTVVWAKLYTPKDKKMPVVLKIGYNQKRIPKKLASPVVTKIFRTVDEYKKSTNLY